MSAREREALKQHQFTEAVILAAEQCGTLLAEHFPPYPDDPNESRPS